MSLTEAQLLSIARKVTPIALDLYDKEKTENTVLPKIASIVTRKATNKRITLEWLTAFPELRKWMDDKTIQTAFREDMEMVVEPYEITYEFDRIDRAFDDVLADVSDMAPKIANGFAQGKVFEAYKVLRENRPTYDGQDFFDTDHTHPNGAVFSNIVVKARTADATPTVAEARAELKAAKQRLQKNQIIKNVLVSAAQVQAGLVVIVKHSNVYDAYETLLTEDEIDGVKNMHKGSFELLLDVNPTSGTDYTVDFIQALPNGPRPVIMAIHKDFSGIVIEPEKFTKRKVAFGAEGQYGWEAGFPQVAVRRTNA